MLMEAERACALFADPAAVDTIVARFEAATGAPARLAATGETFAAVGARRKPRAKTDAASRRPLIRRFGPPSPARGEGGA